MRVGCETRIFSGSCVVCVEVWKVHPFLPDNESFFFFLSMIGTFSRRTKELSSLATLHASIVSRLSVSFFLRQPPFKAEVDSYVDTCHLAGQPSVGPVVSASSTT